MDLEKEKLQDFIRNKIKLFAEENEIDHPDIISNETKLLGSNAIFDSIDLVRFIVEIEESLEEKFSIEMELTDEKAMSRRTSPFINATTLAQYIIERLNEK